MKPRSRVPFYFAIFLLIAAGISLAVWRHIEFGIPWFSGEQKPVWMVEARIDFNGTGAPVLASLNVPDDPPGFRILSEQAASPGYGFSIVEERGIRRAEWSKREVSGPQTLYFKVQFVPEELLLRQTPKRRPKTEPVFWEEPEATAVDEILEQARSRSSTPQSLTRELIKLLQPDSSRAQNTTLLVSDGNYMDLLSRMLNHAGIPARTADGLHLEDARRRQTLRPYLQIFDGQSWLTFNPMSLGATTPRSAFPCCARRYLPCSLPKPSPIRMA